MTRAFRQYAKQFFGVVVQRYPLRKLWPFSSWSHDEQSESDAQRMIKAADRLTALMQQPGWQDLLACKDFYQHLYDRKSKEIGEPDTPQHQQMRTIAATHYMAVEGFFKALAIAVSQGQQAAKRLRQRKEAEQIPKT